ncbi:MAG: hypothetical protein ACLQBK_14860 [Candidatus Sulfotelmatobacter sp.]
MKELFVSILAHIGPRLPNWILRRMYPAERLASGIRFSFPNGAVEMDLSNHELRTRMSAVSVLPFDVKLKYLHVEIQPKRAFRLATVCIPREFTLKAQDETIVGSYTFSLSEYQVRRARENPGNVWLFGEADLQAPFGTKFEIPVKELSCTPNVY